MRKTFALLSLTFIFLFLTFSLVPAFDFPSDKVTITTLTGNLTNLSQMGDVNIPSPGNNEVLTWSSSNGVWESTSAQAVGDTNETVRFDALVDVDCSGTDKMIGVQSNGTVLCGADNNTGSSGGQNTSGVYLYNDTNTHFFNITLAGTNLAVNSSDQWDNLDTFNTTHFSNDAGILTIVQSWLIGFIDSLITTNNISVVNYITTVNTSMKNYVDGTFLINGTSVQFTTLNVTGTSYLGNVIIEADNVTTNNIISKDGNTNIFSSIGTLIAKFFDNGNLSVEGNITANEFFGDIEADFVKIALGSGSPTVDQLQEYLDNTGSSGFFLGGELSDGGAGTLDVAAGSGFIRTTNDDNAELQSFKWDASAGIAVTDDTTQYVYVDYTGTISLSTDEFLEAPDKIQIGVVTDEAGSISHFFDLGVRLEESVGQAGRFIRRVFGISRDTRKGGLVFGQSGDANRDVTITEGVLWWGRTDYTITSFDTSGADTFATYSAGGQENATASQWDNDNFDNSGTLQSLGNNKWANLFFYIEPDDHISMVYGRAEFTTQASAEMEGVPSSSLPSGITETSILAARFTFQKSANTATISSAFDTLFANAGVTDHGDLAGLGDDDHTQYLLGDGTRGLSGNWDVGNFNITSDFFFGNGSQLTDIPTLDNDDIWNIAGNGTLMFASDWNATNTSYMLNTGDIVTGNYTFDSGTLFVDSNNDRVGIGTTSPGATLDVNGGILQSSDTNVDLYMLTLRRSGAGNTVADIATDDDGGLVLGSAGGDATLVIANNERVGIGTTSPDFKLQVDGDIVSETNGTDSIGTKTIRWLKGWFTDLDISNNLTVGGNVTAIYYFGNGSQLTDLPSSADATWLANYSLSDNLNLWTTTFNQTTNDSLNNYIDSQDIVFNNSISDWSINTFVNLSGDTMTGDLDITNSGNLNITTGNVSTTGRIILAISDCSNMQSGEICKNATGVFIQG